MDLNEYQEKLVEIWENNKDSEDLLLFCCVGMAEEAGELMGKIKRSMRGEGFDREGYLLELGDCLAYLAMAAYSKGWLMTDIFSAWITPEGSDLVRQGHQLFKKTELALDCALYPENHTFKAALQSSFMHIFMQLHWNASHSLIGSTVSEVMQMNIDKLIDRKARLGTLRGSGDNR